MIARYGGDEFVIICPGLCREGAISMVNRLRTFVLPMGIELSIGVATYPSDGQNMAEIIKLADKLMYKEKEEHHARHKIAKIGK
jgi:diguanylate cyclase (GGDEF)-like protein